MVASLKRRGYVVNLIYVAALLTAAAGQESSFSFLGLGKRSKQVQNVHFLLKWAPAMPRLIVLAFQPLITSPLRLQRTPTLLWRTTAICFCRVKASGFSLAAACRSPDRRWGIADACQGLSAAGGCSPFACCQRMSAPQLTFEGGRVCIVTIVLDCLLSKVSSCRCITRCSWSQRCFIAAGASYAVGSLSVHKSGGTTAVGVYRQHSEAFGLFQSNGGSLRGSEPRQVDH